MIRYLTRVLMWLAVAVAGVAGIVTALVVVWPYLQPFLREQQYARLFPQAAEVRLYAWVFTDAEPRTRELVPDGVPLSKDEVVALRRAVYWVRPPETVAGCCIPRHAFKFYDAQHKLLGTLKVCFECLCANLDGEAPPRSDLTSVDWNVSAVGDIIRAHNLPIDFEWDETTKSERPKRN